jgi:site-specific recombinase XerD
MDPWWSCGAQLLMAPERLLINSVYRLRYRVYFFALYSMGLRLGEGLSLEVGDIDAAQKRVHVRMGKGGKDRYVPIPDVTLQHLAASGVLIEIRG